MDVELQWWQAQLDKPEQAGLPLATRYSFPGASSENVLVTYSDASREDEAAEGEVVQSGAGAWCVMRGIFYYVHWRWTRLEIKRHSINVLEAHARDAAGWVFLDKAREIGCPITHKLAYVDNTAAENVAESGRATTEMLNELNLRRLQQLRGRSIYEANERVTSVDNDVADLLSRGDIKEALRFPQDCDMSCVELEVQSAYRDLPPISDQ